jgi:uncharacterized protein (DUF2252 family)
MTSNRELLDEGKTLRNEAPRSSHGDWAPAADRPDPISLLEAQDEGRLQHLLPIKYGRMLASPFSFLRGSAVVMAADLADSPTTGLDVVLCGDAHLSNFGLFATPERKLVFDINDFDEVYPGPWEWDLKRLAASAVVAGRGNTFDKKTCRQLAVVVAKTYALAMERFSVASTLGMWYYHVDADAVLKVFEAGSSKKGRKGANKMVGKARTRTQERTLEKLTEVIDGRRKIISNPPLVVPFWDETLVESTGGNSRLFVKDLVEKAWNQYRDGLSEERRYLLQRYRIVDGALRVGGVGSVGTHCSILLLEGSGSDDALILQTKEAGPSSLAAYLGERSYPQQAARVVIGQRLMQATTDMFLGWHSGSHLDLDFYWRQLKDMKGSARVEKMDVASLETYLKLCSWCLARAHARTGNAAIMSGYMGSGKCFAGAIGDLAVAYSDQTERDYQSLKDAVHSGRVIAEMGI